MSAIQNRIEKNVKTLAPWAAKLQIEAYRIYERDIPEYPFIVDRYKDQYVVYDRSNELDERPEKQAHFPELIEALKTLFSLDEKQIIIKRRERHSHKTESQYEKIATTNHTLVVREGPALFYVNLYDYLDTGLFLDHRLMREKIFKTCREKRMLNLFSYTASVSVFAALGGAKTTSVDMSATYTNWAKDNFTLNKLPLTDHDFVTMSALEYLANQHISDKFDVIFCDPPTFSNSKKMATSFEVERDQEILLDGCMRKLAPGGVLYFSNNKRSFRLLPALAERYKVRDISESTIPKDFRDKKIHRVFEFKI